jgi:DNA-binding transcriptional MerR regulator
MNHFTIKDIENLCGIKAHTLRMWERRYNFFAPKRKGSQHRVYDSDDLKALLRISFLYHNGYKISKIAQLNPQQIEKEVANSKLQHCSYELYVHQLVETSLQLDNENFERVSNEIVSDLGMEKAILHVFYPFLNRIGLLWMTNHVIPAQEHFSSHIIRKKIISATDALKVDNHKKYNVAIFSPSGELHEIPLLVVNYLFRKKGIKTTYFGVNVAAESLVYYCRYHSISHFYSHLITHLDSAGLADYMCTLCNYFPDKVIFLSGPASACVQQKPVNLVQIHSLDEVINLTVTLSEV